MIQIFNDVLSKNTYLKYLQCIDIFLNQATKQTFTKEQWNVINSFFEYVNNNKESIWDANGNRLIGSSSTEHFIYKTMTSNKHATYSLELFKKLMIFNNKELKIAVVFLN
ncbi:hypothetical protein [Mesomycoplasma conjunctivae]|uniref:hypothetical protein n=1 Tax=Mesomycoplasma conjunctivae TaxID=45361 RepID=UPI003DA4153C